MLCSHRPDADALRRAVVAAGLLLLAGAAGAKAASFVLDDGTVIEGRLIASTRNTLTVRAAVGGIRQIPLSQLAGVRALTPSGRTVAGLLREVDGDRFAIAIGPDRVHWIEDDRVVVAEGQARPSVEATASLPPAARPQTSADAPGPQPAEGAGAAERPSPSSPTDTRAPREEPVPAAIPPAVAATASRETSPSAGNASGTPPRLEVSTAGGEAAEGDGAVTFEVRLSHASESTISLVYSTVDGEATAGSDYEPEQGVLLVPAGETSRTIKARLLDDGDAEEPEQFFLFVTVDPADALLAEKWHAVTIQDDD